MKVPKHILEELGMFRVILTDNQHKMFTNLIGEDFDVVTYLPLDVVLSLLNDRKSHVCRYVLIEHNKVDDLYDINHKTLKKEHIHIVVSFIGRHRASSLVNMFNTTEVRRIETSQQLKGSILYLTHESTKAIAQGKVKYEKSKLISNDILYFDKVVKETADKTNTSLQIIDMMHMGIPHRELVSYFGRDYVINYEKYKCMAQLISEQETIAVDYNGELLKK